MLSLLFAVIWVVPCFAAEENICWGLSARQGDRKSMEDTHIHCFPFQNDSKKGLFGIFDGHSGSIAATLAATELPGLLSVQEECSSTTIFKTFQDLDSRILTSAPDGSCALIAHILQNTLRIAWAGDSRAVLARKNEVFFATTDHKPDNAHEKSRIKLAGGFVSNYDVPRINGILAVSRALGNKELKIKNLLIAEPDIQELNIQQGDVLILACDGIWDVFSNAEAFTIVNKALALSKQDLESLYPANPLLRKFDIINGTLQNLVDPGHKEEGDEHMKLVARALRDEAYRKGSRDNLSVQVIKFN
jgi:serine/threonine protein phosphatase PrpC